MAPPAHVPRPDFSWRFICILVAVVFLAGAAAVAGGAWTDGPKWLGWAGLAIFVLGCL